MSGKELLAFYSQRDREKPHQFLVLYDMETVVKGRGFFMLSRYDTQNPVISGHNAVALKFLGFEC